MANDPKLWAVGIAVTSLLWNVANTFYTRSVDKGSRHRAIKLDEFRSSVKQPIEEALRQLEECETSADVFLHPQTDVSDQADKLIELNKSIVSSMVCLLKRLENADRSDFTSSQSWDDLYYAKEDAIFQPMNIVTLVSSNDSEKREALKLTTGNLKGLRRSIQAVLEKHIQSI